MVFTLDFTLPSDQGNNYHTLPPGGSRGTSGEGFSLQKQTRFLEFNSNPPRAVARPTQREGKVSTIGLAIAIALTIA